MLPSSAARPRAPRLVVSALVASVLALLVTSSCAAVKDAQLSAAEAVQPRAAERVAVAGAGDVEVRCGLGELCAEVHVVHVQRGDAADEAVDVTVQNRTEEPVAVQVAVEAYDRRARRTDRTGFFDVVLAPRGESVVSVVTHATPTDTLVLHLRPRRG